MTGTDMMRKHGRAGLCAAAAVLLSLFAFGARAAPMDSAVELLQAGKLPEAKQAFESILRTDPKEPRALFFAATINAAQAHPELALPQLLALLQIAPASLPALELEVQVYQALGKTEPRDEAIERLRTVRTTAFDPGPRFAVGFVRDRFVLGGRTFITFERFENAGETVVRYIFIEESERDHPVHFVILMSDPETNDRWHEIGQLPEGTAVLHLDAVFPGPNGGQVQVPYANYVEAPAYDTVRTLAAGILSGKAEPLSGQPDPYWSTVR